MAILNYTTSIAAEKTVTEIQGKLAKAGASAILTEYDDNGVLSAMSFRITANGQLLSFRLPARIDGVFNRLKNDNKVARSLKTKEQAAKVAWRILKDWIEAQIALVQAEQADMAEVFLPYAQNQSGETLYEKIKGGGFLALTDERKTK